MVVSNVNVVVARACKPSLRRLRQEKLESEQHIEFQASLGYIMRHCLKIK